MSILSKLNPLTLIKNMLVSDYVGGLVRHFASFIGGLLLAKGLGDVATVQQFVESFSKLLTDPEFIGGLVTLISSLGASVANKRAE